MSEQSIRHPKFASYTSLIQRVSSLHAAARPLTDRVSFHSQIPSSPLAGNVTKNHSTDSLAPLASVEESHTLVGYGELRTGYLAGLLAYDANGDLVVPESKKKRNKSGSRHSSPSKYSMMVCALSPLLHGHL
jgi:hypothetical protein